MIKLTPSMMTCRYALTECSLFMVVQIWKITKVDALQSDEKSGRGYEGYELHSTDTLIELLDTRSGEAVSCSTSTGE